MPDIFTPRTANLLPGPIPAPDGDEATAAPADTDMTPFAGPLEGLADVMPIQQAQLYQDAEHEMLPLESMGARLTGLITGDDEFELRGAGQVVRRQGIPKDWAGFLQQDEEGRQNFQQFVSRMDGRGLAYGGSRKQLIEGASEYLSSELGAEWQLRASKSHQAQLWAAGMLHTAVVGSNLKDSELPGVNAMVMEKMLPQLRAQPKDMTPGRFAEELSTLTLWSKFAAHPALYGGIRDQWAMRQMAEKVVAPWYTYLTGASPVGVANEDIISTIKGVVYGYDGLKSKLTQAAKWQRVGVQFGTQDLQENGHAKIGQLPFYREAIDDYAFSLTNNSGDGDRAQLTRFNARKWVEQRLAETPAEIPTQLLPEAEQNPRLRDYVTRLVSRLANIADPVERHRAFRKEINGPAQASRQIQVLGPVHNPLYSGWTPEEEAVLRALPDRLDTFEIGFAAKELERLQKVDQLKPRGWDPQASLAIAANSRQANQAEGEMNRRLAEGLANAPVTNAVLWPLKAMSYLVEKTGVPRLNRALLGPALTEITEAALSTPQPEGLQLVLPPLTPGQELMRNVIGYKHDIADTQLRYAQRAAAGEAGWLDDLWLLTSTVGDMFLKLPQAAMEDPLSFAAFGAVAGRWGKVQGKIGDLAIKAGVPVRIAGAMEMAMNPVSGKGIGKLMGHSPELVRRLGMWPTTLVRALNKIPGAPKVKEAVQTFWSGYMAKMNTAAREHPEIQISKVESTMAALMAKAEKGDVSLNDVWNLDLKELSDVGARQLFLPFARAKLSIGSGGPEGAAQFVTEMAHVQRLERELRSDTEAAAKIGKPLSGLFVDAINAVNEGKYPLWRAALNSRLGKAVRVPERWVEYFDRSVKLEDVAPHAQQAVADAMGALQVHGAATAEVAQLYSFASKRAAVQAEGLESDIRVLQYEVDLAQRWSHLTGPQQAEMAALPQLLVGKQRQLAVLRNWQTQYGNEIALIDRLGKTDIGGMHGAEGLEVGTRHNLTKEAQNFVFEGMADLVEEHGAAGLKDFGLPMEWTRHFERAHEAAQRGLEKSDRRLGYGLQALGKGDTARAAQIMGLPKDAPVESIWQRAAELNDSYMQAKAGLTQRIRKVARDKMPKQLFNVPALAKVQQELLAGARTHMKAMNNLASMEAGPGGTYFELINLVKNPMYINRALGLLDVYSAAQNNINTLMLNRLTRTIHKLPPGDRKELNRILTDGETATTSQQLTEIMFDDAHLRNSVVDLLVRKGTLTEAQAEIFRSRPYKDHYYVNHFKAAELRRLGVPLGMEDPLSAATPIARLPEYEAIQVQRSFRQARVRLSDGRTEYFTVAEHGDANKANKAAKDWVQERLDAHELRPDDILGTDKALRKEDGALLGLIGSDGGLRVDRIRDLFADSMRNDFFAHVAMVSGLKRTGIADIPLKRRQEWTKQPLKGKDWGPLEGFYVHKGLLRIMNTWDQWHEVMNAASEAVKQQIAEVWTPTGMMDKVLYGEESTSTGAKTVRWLDRQWRNNFILRNPGSWVNNHLGALMSAMMSGVNPVDPRFWRARSRFFEVLDDFAQGKAKGTPEIGRGKDDYSLFEDQALSGGLAATGGLPGKVHLEEAAKVRMWNAKEVFGKVKEGIQAEQRQAANELLQVQQAKRNLQTVLLNGKLTDKEVARAKDDLEAWSELEKDLKRKVITSSLKSPELHTAHLVGREAWRNLAHPDKAHLSQLLADQYGLVDPSYRYATYHYLRTVKNMSRERALDMIQELFQNYSAVPPWVRALQQQPIVGAFVPSFAYEAGRMLINSLYYNPNRFFALHSVPFIMNMANMTANGIMPQEYFSSTNARTWADQLKELFTTVRVDVGDTSVRWNLAQASFLAPFLQPSGGLRTLATRAGEAAEQNLPYAASLPLTALGNYVSNFVLNTPLTELGARHIFGVDQYKQEVNYTRFGDIGALKSYFGDIASAFAPRFAVRAMEEFGSVGMSSLLTKHNKGVGTALLRAATGQGISVTPRRELFARTLLKYSNIERSGQLLHEAATGDEDERRALLLRAGVEPDIQKRGELLRKAAQLIKQAKSGKVLVGETWVDTGMTDEQALRAAINQASANLYSEIERIPIDKMPLAIHDIETSSLASTNKPEVEHMWRQLLDPKYIAGRGDLADMATTARLCFEFAESGLRPETRAKYTQAGVNVIQQMRKIIKQKYSVNQLRALRTKVGQWPAAVQRLMYMRLGL